ncbi:hypothetical protein B0H34DRAFT_402388 [Crassisporium funariophilum]|nr:hypothetical protein B0H34DRAFT_402388 [Crassisporium funariophilum]
MSDTTSIRSSSRASTFLNRPNIAPMGPRTRQSSRTSHLLDISLTSPMRLELQEFGVRTTGSPPPITPTSPGSSFRSDRKSLPAVSEEPPTPPSQPDSAPAYNDESVVASTSQAQLPPAKVVATASPPPKLVPPPAIKFDTSPVPWKGLPLEAALWTVDSGELQGIVSRAIRSSARESFIRLLTVNNLDTVLPAELERLDALKTMTQSRYRFLVHRRTMLFHALNSSSVGHNHREADEPMLVIGRLASQLAETVAECDKQLEEVLSITDQMAQINKLIDVHWGSALAIALRKLNGSYARRTTDLVNAKERISQLEAELEDAWKEAEKMAKELDDYEADITADDAEAIIEVAEVVPVPTSPTHTRRSSIPMTPTLLSVSPMPPPTPPKSTTPRSPLTPMSTLFNFPPAVHMRAKEKEADDVPDTVSIRSNHSTRSAKSTRSYRSTRSGRGTDATHTSAVYAAKKRSHRASQSSLRLNTGHMRKHSNGKPKTPYEDQPPVPELPLQFTNTILPTSSANASSILLHHFETPSRSELRRQASLDTVRTGRRSPGEAFRGRATDDLYVRPSNANASTSEIQLVSRTPPYKFASMYESGPLPPRPPPKDFITNTTTKSIPSMWMNADAVKPQPQQLPPVIVTPVEPSPIDSISPLSRRGSSKTTTYSRFRTLTKRYSVSLPLFNNKLSQPRATSRSRSG